MPMTIKRLRHIAALIFCLTFFAQHSNAQFKEGAFTQNYNEPGDSLSQNRDSVDKLFSFKEFFGGLSHRNKMKIGTMTVGSAIFIGSSQIYNKDYWKLPIIYGGIGSLAGTGGYYIHKYTQSKKASSPTFISLLGNRISVRELLPVKAYEPIRSRLESWEIVTVLRL